MPTSTRAYGASKTSRRRARRYVLLPIVGCAAWAFLFVLYKQHEVLGEPSAPTPRGDTRAASLATPSSTPSARAASTPTRGRRRRMKQRRRGIRRRRRRRRRRRADDDDEGTPEELRDAAEKLMASP